MFELATPLALLALPLPLLMHQCFPQASLKARQALIIPNFHRITGDLLQQTQSAIPWWLGLCWVLIVIASAGPRWIGEPTPLEQEGHNIMMALDISGSMAITDMQWNHRRTSRFAVVKNTARTFVRERPGDKIGLILFGTRAYIQTPLTFDRTNVLSRLDDSTVGLAGNSTSLGDAIGLSIKHLQHTHPEGRILILLTDGANNSGTLSPLKAAELAKTERIKIYTIGLGQDASASPIDGLFYPPHSGMELDEETLKQIAQSTDGHYFRANNQASLQEIYTLINQMETIPEEQETIRPQHDYYPWPLGLALCIFLLSFWRQKT
jgi:Ca-activated chloride channel family protein